MAVSIRLSRAGRRHLPFYHIDVFDRRTRRDGKPVERLGFYAPEDKKEEVRLDSERATYWLKNGAKPTETVQTLLKRSGLNAALWSHVSVKKVKDPTDAPAKPKRARPAELRAKKKVRATPAGAEVAEKVKKRKPRTANSKARAARLAKKS